MLIKNNSIWGNQRASDAILTLLFGALSVILGMIQFQTPGFENSYSDLREIALLISLFHLRNPIYLIPLCLITLIGIPEEVPLVPTFLMHVIPLFIAWLGVKWIERKKISNVYLGVTWFIIALAYYTLLLYPILIISYHWYGFNSDQSFGTAYKSILASGKFEMIATALVSSLYLIQFEIKKSLELTNKNLEEIVLQRTRELVSANFKLNSLNEELVASNEEVKSLNENLERLIKERTERINLQLTQLTKYAYMNSHEVRAPLARILGLLSLLKIESNGHSQELLDKLIVTSEELDEVIKSMNRLLEKEIE